ncbi:MAG: aldehyde dehydrogenase family protein [Sedimentisphaerales bacterium]|nr:aldehyde dehydrogenase family protein [Sedimentisphaerales bacterium]
MDNPSVIPTLISKARAAQKQIENYTQQQIDELCLAVGWQVYKDDNIAACAKIAVEETGMGVYEDKLKKHKVKVLGVCKDITGAKSVGLIERDEARGLSKYAKPVGVIGALCPVTNPTATPASNAVTILKGRNAVIFAPHPRAKESCKVVCNFMRQGLAKVGAPQDLIQWIEEPSVPLSQELMAHVDLVVATGGGAMVKSAYSSGTPAYGVGAGNPVIIVAEDADIEDAAEKIFISKTFDNATSCSSDNSIVIHSSVFDKMVEAFKKRKGYLCSDDEKKTLHDYVWVPSKKTGKLGLNPDIIAVSAKRIADGAGLKIPNDVTMLIVIDDQPGQNKWSGEKLSPVMTLWKYDTFDEAMAITRKIHEFAGMGHSCGIHTFHREYIDQLGLAMKVSRIMVRQAHAPSCGGNFHNAMPSTVTLGCGTWGGNITTENIAWKHFINVTWVSEPFAPQKPTEQEIWGQVWSAYGK